MVGGGEQPQPQSQPQPLVFPPTATTTTTAEEEALKRNTDCVYFLASPLTCKKGSECEYRHSDIARVNPRDCWFWLNGNCLNPSCGFRHPPLDGLLGAQVPTPVGSSLPGVQVSMTSAVHATYISGKQRASCIFFQKGFCLKGDRCPFLHGPNSVSNKTPHALAAIPSTELPKKAFGVLKKCTHEQKVVQANMPKSADLPSQTNLTNKGETAPTKNGVARDKNVSNSLGFNAEFSGHQTTYVPPATNGNSASRSNCMYQAHISDDHIFQNGKDTDEFSREHSPGFDVLVDDELRDSDYYHNEDHFGRGHREGRNLNPANEYEDHICQSADYNLKVNVDREENPDPHGYNSYEHFPGQYDLEQHHRASSERIVGGSAHRERKRYSRAKSPDQIDESDLRYRLSKRRRVCGLRSIISHDNATENHVEDRGYWDPQRESNHLTSHEGSLSSRLQGRIKIPGRSLSPDNGNDLLRDEEIDQGRNHGRSSQGKPFISVHQRKLRDVIKGRVQEDLNNDGRSFRGARMRRDLINDSSTDFAGPKSLAELKGGKIKCNEHLMNDWQSLETRKCLKLEQYEGDLYFVGPKPLSEILKRKRETEIEASGSDMASANHEENIQEIKRTLIRSTVAKETGHVPYSVIKAKTVAAMHNNNEESKLVEANIGRAEDGSFCTENGKPTVVQHSMQCNASEQFIEDGMNVDEAIKDHEPEGYDQRDGDYDHEQDGEDYTLDEGENADPEDDYLDDDDGDDFAKKMGVVYT